MLIPTASMLKSYVQHVVFYGAHYFLLCHFLH